MDESNKTEGRNETDSGSGAVVTQTAESESSTNGESGSITTGGTAESGESTRGAVATLTAESESEASSQPEPESTDGSEDASGADQEVNADPEQAPESRTKRRNFLPLIIPAAAVVLFAGGLALRTVIPFRTELGEEVKFSFPRFLIDADTTSVNKDVIGEYSLPAKVLGFIGTGVKMRVSDTTPPKVTLRQPVIMTGQKDVKPEDFVESCEDAQAVTYEFGNAPDFLTESGTKEFYIVASDASGNKSKLQASCELDASIAGIRYELGAENEKIAEELAAKFGVKTNEIEGVSAGAGEHPARIVSEKPVLFTYSVTDTTPPKAEPNALDIFLGERLLGAQIERFVTNIEDESEVEVAYASKEPNWDKVGSQNVKLKLTDAAGNVSELESKLRVHDIPREITVEAGTTTSELFGTLLKNCADYKPTLDSAYELSYKPLGTHELTLNGEFSELSVSVTVEDTKAPELETGDITTDRGVLPDPSEFVTTCRDATAVSYEYAVTPDVSEIGDVYVTIIATDEGGNKTTAGAWLTVIADLTPPVLYGVKDIYSYEGDAISYRAGVSAVDEADGRVTVYVDSSQVRTGTAGTYPITYRATDSSGNTASEKAYVYVRRVTQSTLDEYADSILDEIIDYGMTERERARAIYDWCRENLKYSTVTSHLIGNYYKSAYSGYKLHYGNCYTYYAVARSLLTRTGITNQMIQRNNPSKPHYWNLVKIDGCWYHFDTCPQPYPNNVGCFLLTDAEVADYSANQQSGYYNFTKGIYPATP